MQGTVLFNDSICIVKVAAKTSYRGPSGYVRSHRPYVPTPAIPRTPSQTMVDRMPIIESSR